jgi:hypothetical protein
VVEAMVSTDAASNIKETINDYFINVSRFLKNCKHRCFLHLGNDKNIELPAEVDRICLQS